MKNLGTKLRTLRELHNYKQEYVGSVLGLSQTGYGKIENGEVENISLKHLQGLAELYQVSLEQLLGWDGKISIGTFNNNQGVGINQGTAYLQTPEDRIKQLEMKVEKLLELVNK
jgi:transcriptional regulator with XRE-family HTH domain